MALFVIADLHLSFGVNKPMDIFPGWANYAEILESNWRRLVSDEDTIVLAGDISWGMKIEECLADFQFIDKLPGKKIILKGNHDYWWSTKNKIEGFWAENNLVSLSMLNNNAYEADGKIICGTRGWLYNSETAEDIKITNREVGRLRMSLKAGDEFLETNPEAEKIVFLHYPPVYDGMECAGILDEMKSAGIKNCYYGHIHGKYAALKAPTGEYEGIKMKLISCDYVNFRPVLVR